MEREIAIVHRRKQTAAGEARPTKVRIFADGQKKPVDIELATDTDELDFVQGKLPVKWVDVNPDADLTGYALRHLKTRRIKSAAELTGLPTNLLLQGGKPIELDAGVPVFKAKAELEVVTKVPSQYEGLQAGDTVLMILGGSGDRLAYAMSNPRTGAVVQRVPTFVFSEYQKDEADGLTRLIGLWRESPSRFYPVVIRDRTVIKVKMALEFRTDAMKARMASDQRLNQRYIGQLFCSDDGGYPEGGIEDGLRAFKSNSEMLQCEKRDEEKLERELAAMMRNLDIYQRLFVPLEGVGPLIAARLISAIGSVKRFKVEPDPVEIERLRTLRHRLKTENKWWYDDAKNPIIVGQLVSSATSYDRSMAILRHYQAQGNTSRVAVMEQIVATHQQVQALNRAAKQKGASKLKRFCGVHVITTEGSDVGTFPRRRHGQVANWHPDARQALYLLGDQFNRRPDSVWGIKQRQYKSNIRAKHLETKEIIKDGATITQFIYSDGHVHKTATWRALSRFVEWLYREWLRIEEAN